MPSDSPESDSEPLFPEVGEDATPTQEMIVRGAFGNGSWNLKDGSVDAAYEAAYAAKKEERDQRQHFFNENAKDALKDSIEYHHSIVRQAQLVIDKIARGEEVSKIEQHLLKLGQSSALEIANRGLGKAKQISEHTEHKSLLSLIVKRDET